MQSQYLNDLQTLLDCRSQIKVKAKQAVDKQLASQYWKVGNKYAEEKDVPQNADKAVYWLEKAAASQHNAEWWWELGQRYACGQGIYKNTQRAAYWLEKAVASQHNTEWWWELGVFYTKDNLDKAVYWLTKAAEQGDSSMQWRLGKYYASTQQETIGFSFSVIPYDSEKAEYWFSKAIENNMINNKSEWQYNAYELGTYYLAGQGGGILKRNQYGTGYYTAIPKNIEKASYWLKKVIDNGFKIDFYENNPEYMGYRSAIQDMNSLGFKFSKGLAKLGLKK